MRRFERNSFHSSGYLHNVKLLLQTAWCCLAECMIAGCSGCILKSRGKVHWIPGTFCFSYASFLVIYSLWIKWYFVIQSSIILYVCLSTQYLKKLFQKWQFEREFEWDLAQSMYQKHKFDSSVFKIGVLSFQKARL